MKSDINTKDNTRSIIGMGFLAVFSLMLLVTWLSMNALHSVNDGMSTLVTNMDAKSTRAYQMRDVIRQRSGAVRTLVQTEELLERQRIFEKLIEDTDIYEETRNELVSLGANTREQTILQNIDQAYVRVTEAYDKTGHALSAVNLEVTELRPALNEVYLQELVLLNHLNELVKLERQLAAEALQNNQATYHRTRTILFFMVVAAFAVSITISIIVAVRVSRANRRIAHLANHDDLTGLHNRRSFELYLQQTIAIAQRSEMTYGLIFLDLDRFKMVNDTCGHHAGDQLLIKLTELVSERLRMGDLFARLGGDEFAIIAQASSFDAIRALAEELRLIIHDYTFSYDEHNFNITVSMGAAPVDGQVKDMDSILADVDSACYIAKQAGRNRLHVSGDQDPEVAAYRDNLAGVQAVRQALHNDRLSLFFQPVFDIQADSLVMAQCEILLRVRNENGELYSPGRFIPEAEKYNIMIEIDRWVFSQVTDWLAENQANYQIPLLLINLSGLSFADEDFNDFIVQRLQQSDIDASCIAFEISEGAAVRNFQKAESFSQRMRTLGCQLALDDFGSGFSNFAYLKQLSFDYLKIDGALVRNIANNEIDRQMIEAINKISHTVGARTIAEFVEDDGALQCLRELNVDYAQGHGMHMPTPLAQLTAELKVTRNATVSEIEQPGKDDVRRAS